MNRLQSQELVDFVLARGRESRSHPFGYDHLIRAFREANTHRASVGYVKQIARRYADHPDYRPEWGRGRL